MFGGLNLDDDILQSQRRMLDGEDGTPPSVWWKARLVSASKSRLRAFTAKEWEVGADGNLFVVPDQQMDGESGGISTVGDDSPRTSRARAWLDARGAPGSKAFKDWEDMWWRSLMEAGFYIKYLDDYTSHHVDGISPDEGSACN